MDKKITIDKLIEERKDLWWRTGSITKDKDFINRMCKYIQKNEHLYKELYDDPSKMIELLFYVTDKESNLVPFTMNDVQRKFVNQFKHYLKLFKDGKIPKMHFIILKGRQQGFTTIIAALQLAYTLTRLNYQSYTLADSASNAETIFLRKAKFMFDYLNEIFKPTKMYDHKKELYFDKLNTQWKVSTAGNKDAGRSMSINFFHGSEVGMWENTEELLGGLNRAIVPTGFAFLESTAKGQNFFKELWDRDNNYIKLFYEWWQTSEYRQKFINDKQKEEFVKAISRPYKNTDDAENLEWVVNRCYWLYKEKNVNLEQVFWYYNQWKEMRSIIKQEFPCYPEEAFMSSGDNVFCNDKIAEYVDRLKKLYSKEPYKKGFFKVEYHNPETRDAIKEHKQFVEDFNGCLKIYEEPIKLVPYVIGADPANGGADFYAATVINNLTGERVATMHARMSPDEFVAQLYALGKHYNYALIAPEINIDPYSVMELTRFGYWSIYRRVAFDKTTQEKTEKLGWRTDKLNRELMITNHKVELRNEIHLFRDVDTLQEALTFVLIDGKAQAASGKHDDLIMSDMIASAIRSQQTVRMVGLEEVKKEGFYTETELNWIEESSGMHTGVYNSDGSAYKDYLPQEYLIGGI